MKALKWFGKYGGVVMFGLMLYWFLFWGGAPYLFYQPERHVGFDHYWQAVLFVHAMAGFFIWFMVGLESKDDNGGY